MKHRTRYIIPKLLRNSPPITYIKSQHHAFAVQGSIAQHLELARAYTINSKTAMTVTQKSMALFKLSSLSFFFFLRIPLTPPSTGFCPNGNKHLWDPNDMSSTAPSWRYPAQLHNSHNASLAIAKVSSF